MTDDCTDIPIEVPGTVGEPDDVEDEATPPEVDVNTITVPVSEHLPGLSNDFDQGDGYIETEAAVDPVGPTEVTAVDGSAVGAGAQLPTYAPSGGADNGGSPQTNGDTQVDTGSLSVDIQSKPQPDPTTRSRPLTPENLHPGNISVEISGKTSRANTEGDHVVAENDTSASPRYFRNKVNTPVSLYAAELQEFMPFNERSLLGRDGAYHQAMTLTSGSCTSDQRLVRRTPLISVKTPPVGTYTPHYFFVEQRKPTPMKPLKVWRGYQGNVYFEPIHVNQANYILPEPPPSPPLEQYSDTLQQIMKRSKRKHSSPPRTITRNSVPLSLTETAASPADENAPSRGGGSVVKGNRKMALLDQDAILEGDNEALREDIVWLVGMQAVGSLRIDETAGAKRGPTYEKHRICKGSVAHKIYALRNKDIPLLSLASAHKSGGASPKPPTPRAPGGSMQTSYNSFPELAVLRSRARRPGQAGQENVVPHDLISARPPALDRMNFEDSTLHFNARPFPGYGLRGGVRVSRNASPRQPQHRIA